VSKPAELLEAELVDGLCQRWGTVPSVVLAEDAHYVLRMLNILAEAKPPETNG